MKEKQRVLAEEFQAKARKLGETAISELKRRGWTDAMIEKALASTKRQRKPRL